MIDIRQSVNYANYLKSQGWVVERIDDINYFVKKVPIFGHIIKIQRPKILYINSVNQLISKYKPFQVIIEPNSGYQVSSIKYQGFKLSKNPYLPTKTIHIDLTKSVKEITANMDKNTRYSIRRGEGLKIVDYSSVKKLEKFHQAWKKFVSFTRFVPSSNSLINLRKSFPSTHSLFLASHNINGEIIGGAVFTRTSHNIVYYWYGFTGKTGRTSLSQYSLLQKGLLWGKKQGCKIFDMEGIYDSRFPNKSWIGFSRFKKGFGGKEVLYPGCYVKTNLFKSISAIRN